MTRYVFLLATCLSASGCQQDASPKARGAMPPVRVETASASDVAVPMRRTLLGLVRSTQRAELSVGASGEVRSIAVREGDRVAAGQLLLVIDPSIARADVEVAAAERAAAEADLKQAESDAERLSKAGPRLVSSREIEQATARRHALAARGLSQSARSERARAVLKRHKVEAPFAGTIVSRHVDPGDWVASGKVVLELVSDGELEVVVDANPDILEYLQVGAAATLRAGTRSVKATLKAAVKALDPTARTARLRIVPTETPAWLLAGAAVDVVFDLQLQGPGVTVPRDALVFGAAYVRVVKVVGGKAQLVRVKVIHLGASLARVQAKGLAKGDAVIIRGNDRLRPDQLVNVVASDDRPR